MAFSPDTFKKAIGSPMTPPPTNGAGSDMDLEALMGAPGGENGPMDKEGPGGEGSETALQQALEMAGFQASPEQLNQIKGILGVAGGLGPMAGAEEDLGLPPPPAANKPTSKLGKMFSSGK